MDTWSTSMMQILVVLPLVSTPTTINLISWLRICYRHPNAHCMKKLPCRCWRPPYAKSCALCFQFYDPIANVHPNALSVALQMWMQPRPLCIWHFSLNVLCFVAKYCNVVQLIAIQAHSYALLRRWFGHFGLPDIIAVSLPCDIFALILVILWIKCAITYSLNLLFMGIVSKVVIKYSYVTDKLYSIVMTKFCSHGILQTNEMSYQRFDLIDVV